MWRPKDWEIPYLPQNEDGDFVDSKSFEAGADAMLEAIWKLAEKSPTKTFTFDKRHYQIYEVE